MRIAAKAAWVRGRELASDVSVDCDNGMISAVRSGVEEEADLNVDLLLPGFINAHCHLEYTGLAGKLPRGSIPFGEWLDAIISAKSAMTHAEMQSGVRAGMQQLLAGGCTAVFDSTTAGDLPGAEALPIRRFVFHEVLGLSPERAQEQLGRVLPLLDKMQSGGRLMGSGINPHAPYSVGPTLRARLKELLDERPDLACAWHLAETQDELELIEKESGSIAEFFRRRGLPMPYEAPVVVEKAGCSTLQTLRQDGLLERCDLAFHLNCTNAREAAYFRAPRAVVHCPGTNRFFTRSPFPIGAFTREGVNVCLGTDSLASADTLDMLQVIRYAAEDWPHFGGAQLLDMVTRNPARCRVLANSQPQLGAIEAGFVADFVGLEAEISPSRSMRDLLVDGSTRVKQVLVGGGVIFKA